jgi:hypothetical protein
MTRIWPCACTSFICSKQHLATAWNWTPVSPPVAGMARRYDIRGVMGPDEFHDRRKIVPRNPVAPKIDTLAFSVGDFSHGLSSPAS